MFIKNPILFFALCASALLATGTPLSAEEQCLATLITTCYKPFSYKLGELWDINNPLKDKKEGKKIYDKYGKLCQLPKSKKPGVYLLDSQGDELTCTDILDLLFFRRGEVTISKTEGLSEKVFYRGNHLSKIYVDASGQYYKEGVRDFASRIQEYTKIDQEELAWQLSLEDAREDSRFGTPEQLEKVNDGKFKDRLKICHLRGICDSRGMVLGKGMIDAIMAEATKREGITQQLSYLKRCVKSVTENEETAQTVLKDLNKLAGVEASEGAKALRNYMQELLANVEDVAKEVKDLFETEKANAKNIDTESSLDKLEQIRKHIDASFGLADELARKVTARMKSINELGLLLENFANPTLNGLLYVSHTLSQMLKVSEEAVNEFEEEEKVTSVLADVYRKYKKDTNSKMAEVEDFLEFTKEVKPKVIEATKANAEFRRVNEVVSEPKTPEDARSHIEKALNALPKILSLGSQLENLKGKRGLLGGKVREALKINKDFGKLLEKAVKESEKKKDGDKDDNESEKEGQEPEGTSKEGQKSKEKNQTRDSDDDKSEENVQDGDGSLRQNSGKNLTIISGSPSSRRRSTSASSGGADSSRSASYSSSSSDDDPVPIEVVSEASKPADEKVSGPQADAAPAEPAATKTADDESSAITLGVSLMASIPLVLLALFG